MLLWFPPQIGISYGFGSVHWSPKPNNVVMVPHRLFSPEQDPSQYVPYLSYFSFPNSLLPFPAHSPIPYSHVLIHPFPAPTFSFPRSLLPPTFSFPHHPFSFLSPCSHSKFLYSIPPFPLPLLNVLILPFPLLHVVIPPYSHAGSSLSTVTITTPLVGVSTEHSSFRKYALKDVLYNSSLVYTITIL